MSEPRVTRANVALLTDLYQLTMLQAYWREEMFEPAVFSLFVRRLPPQRNFLIAAGLAPVLHYLETLRFHDPALEYLATQPRFEPGFVDWLAEFRFTGSVRAMPEGTPVFAGEPLLEVRAPLPQAQLVESIVMNQVHLQTTLASKAARVVLAADGRTIVDFAMRRMHGTDAALAGARAFFIAGVDATSNVLAGQLFGIPVAGTMAHSYIEAHDSELEAYRQFAQLYPETILLVDTYDTIEGVARVIALAREQDDAFDVAGIRLDSGDLAALATRARRMLDDAGLQQVRIFASGGLDEIEIHHLIRQGAPIDAFGVGTSMGVSSDVPALDIAYKLVEYAGKPRLKLSLGKTTLPGPKQIFREVRNDSIVRDTIACADEMLPGLPVLETVMVEGRPCADPGDHVTARARARRLIAALPVPIRALDPANPPFPVEISPRLKALQAELAHPH